MPRNAQQAQCHTLAGSVSWHEPGPKHQGCFTRSPSLAPPETRAKSRTILGAESPMNRAVGLQTSNHANHCEAESHHRRKNEASRYHSRARAQNTKAPPSTAWRQHTPQTFKHPQEVKENPAMRNSPGVGSGTPPGTRPPLQQTAKVAQRPSQSREPMTGVNLCHQRNKTDPRVIAQQQTMRGNIIGTHDPKTRVQAGIENIQPQGQNTASPDSRPRPKTVTRNERSKEPA